MVGRRFDARRVDGRSEGAAVPGRRARRSTRISRRSRPRTATTWSSTAAAAPTSATSASTCTAASRGARRTSSRSNPTVGRGSRPTISASRTARSITPDNETLIVGESTAARLTAFDIGTDGKLTNRRVWASLRDIGATPDGICLDADGAVWVACPATDRCVRVAEGGEAPRRGRDRSRHVRVRARRSGRADVVHLHRRRARTRPRAHRAERAHRNGRGRHAGRLIVRLGQ